MHCFSIYTSAYQHFQCNILPLCFDFRCCGDSNKGFTYSQTAGVFGGHVEVDHILAHNDVWNPITIISNLTWSHRLQQTRINIWHTTHWTTTPCNYFLSQICSYYVVVNHISQLPQDKRIQHSQVQTLHPVTQTQDGSSGQTVLSAELVFDWWTTAKALTKPVKQEER